MKVVFTQPFLVSTELATSIEGKVAVLDIAFSNGTTNTGLFIESLGTKLVKWVDHHPHNDWVEFVDDPRFNLYTRDIAPACAVVVTPDVFSEVDTIVTHGDFDGIMSAAKYILGGHEPYEGADRDAIAADSRTGELSSRGRRYEEALKSDVRNDNIRYAIVTELTTGVHDPSIDEAQRKYIEIRKNTERLAGCYESKGLVNFIDVSSESSFDLTQLAIFGQADGKAAVVLYSADGDVRLKVSGDVSWDFVSLFGLSGGMKNVVSLDAARLDEAIEKINA